ncbi:hypothetical protein pb186bvf_002981 [Paramecium bursaria]
MLCINLNEIYTHRKNLQELLYYQNNIIIKTIQGCQSQKLKEVLNGKLVKVFKISVYYIHQKNYNKIDIIYRKQLQIH